MNEQPEELARHFGCPFGLTGLDLPLDGAYSFVPRGVFVMSGPEHAS